jgi:hypothetical protein
VSAHLWVITYMKKSVVTPLIQSRPQEMGPGSLVTPYIESDAVPLFAKAHRLKVCTDVDGTMIVSGKHGCNIYEDDQGKLGVMYFSPSTVKGVGTWTNRRRVGVAAGMLVIQDGEQEGSMLFDSSSLGQAKVAIEIAGLKRKRIMSEAQRQALLKARSLLPGRKGMGATLGIV